MLTAVKVAFGFCIIFIAFEETLSWTVDLPQVRKYFFEKNLRGRERQDKLEERERQQVPYDNIQTSFDNDKYKEQYADGYKDGYMGQKNVDIAEVRKYFFEKSLRDRERQDKLVEERQRQQVLYDNTHTKSQHFDYEKYKEHYAEGYKYNGYMEQKVHEAVQNGSAYLDGLRRAIEAYLRRLETCRSQNMTVNVVQLRPDAFSQSGGDRNNTALYDFLTNPANPLTNPTNPNLVQSGLLNLLLPFSNTGLPVTNLTSITQMNVNFTNLMAMSNNYTMFNMSDEMRDCVRADLASEHVRRLAELAVWAASELQDKLYAEKYSEHGHEHHGSGHENDHSSENIIHTLEDESRGYGHGHEGPRDGHGHEGPHDGHGHEGPHDDDTLVLRLAWFLDRLAYLTSFDPKAEDFVEKTTSRPPTPRPPMFSWVPTMISNADLQLLMTCLGGGGGGGGGAAPSRCALPARGDAPPNPASLQARGWPTPPSWNQLPTSNPAPQPDSNPSASKTEEYTYSEQEFTDDDMPLSLPQRPAKTKRKRSVQGDPLQNFIHYYAKYKTWTAANREEKDSSEMSQAVLPISNSIRKKRFIVKKKGKHIKPDPFPKLASIVKHKLEIHVKKDEKEAKGLKKFFEKLHKPKTEVKLLNFKKSKRSVKYSKKQQPRVPTDPQVDISYYVKNKPGTNYDYNVAQALLVRAGLEQVFQNGNILVVQRYGSNYNPANVENILNGYVAGLADS